MSNTEFVDQDVERLLSGQFPKDPELAELTAVLRALSSYRTVVPSIEASEEMAAEAAAIAHSGQPAKLDLVTESLDARPDRRPSWLPTRVAYTIAGFALLIGVTGTVMAAHTSVPGDPLYGLDRALEEVGIGDGALDERLTEAGVLVATGEEIEAIVLLGATLERAAVAGDEDTADRAQDQIERVVATTSLTAEVAQTKVDQIRTFIIENKGEGVGLDGEDFSSGIREITRSDP